MSDNNYYREAAERLLSIITDTRKVPINRKARDFSTGEIGLLNVLDRKGEALTAGELSRLTGIGSGGTANVLNSLEKKGLIKRDMNPEDRRSVIVTLTESGTALVREKHREAVSHTEELFKALGREDTGEFLRLLARIKDISAKRCEDQTEKTKNQ